jgi:hypothetical protein
LLDHRDELETSGVRARDLLTVFGEGRRDSRATMRDRRSRESRKIERFPSMRAVEKMRRRSSV